MIVCLQSLSPVTKEKLTVNLSSKISYAVIKGNSTNKFRHKVCCTGFYTIAVNTKTKVMPTMVLVPFHSRANWKFYPILLLNESMEQCWMTRDLYLIVVVIA